LNFFASSAYLGLVADVYFEGRSTRVANVRVGEEVLRVLVVDGREVVSEVPFLDYHQPLRPGEYGQVERRRAHAPRVARGIVSSEARHSIPAGFIAAPYVDWSLFASYEDYLARRDERHHDTVKKHRRLKARLAESFGPLEFSADDRRGDVLRLALKWKSAQFIETGESDLFADRRNVRFFEELRERGLLVASTLRASDRLLSVWLGFVHDGVWSGWIFAYDHEPALKQYSVGHHLMQSMLAHSFASGHREFDHSVGGQDWKWTYATHARLIGPLGIPPQSAYRTVRTSVRVALERLGLGGTVRAAKNILGNRR
jgi:hypothetical protein